MKKAFTLAEVLITLGIIGIIAALTLPNLIGNYKKQVVVTRMQKFYSVFNQAVKLVNSEHDESIWEDIGYSPGTNPTPGAEMIDWYKKYLNKHIISNDITQTSDGILIASADGSGFGMYGVHVFFCPSYNYCKKALEKSGNSTYNLFTGNMDGKNLFGFYVNKNGLKAYDICWNGERENLFINSAPTCSYGTYYGCSEYTHKYCAQLIQYDGWKIKDDYPIKF